MSGPESVEPLPIFGRFLARTMGLHFSRERLSELGQKMAVLGKEQGYAKVDDYLIMLMSAPLSKERMDMLALALTIGETYFLRDPKSYQVLEEKLLPELIAARRATDKTLRIWSAGCSSGEEPYSIAILLSRVMPDLADWKVTLLGTDINPSALERARQGVYSKWSFRNAPEWLFDYFTRRKDGRFEIVPRIRNMVRFQHLNMVDESSVDDRSGEMDLIFCRNVMLYFNAAQIEKTMDRLHAALKEGGFLFVGPTEINHHCCRGFSCGHYDGALVLRKKTAQQEAAGHPSPRSQKQHVPSPEPVERGVFAAAIEPPPAALPPKSAAAPIQALAAASPEGAATGANDSPEAAGYSEALALYESGLYQQAADLALASLDGGEQRGVALALALAARAHANIGRFTEARHLCEMAIDCDRLNAHNHYLLSIILEQQGDIEAAVQALKRALFIDHDYLIAYFALGNLCRQAGDRSESQRNYANALRLLERRHPHEVLPEAEGMTAGRLAEVIRAMNREDRG